MLYRSENTIYLLANNKYYPMRVEKNDLIPAKKAIYELKDKTEISYKEAIEYLKGKLTNKASNNSTRGLKIK